MALAAPLLLAASARCGSTSTEAQIESAVDVEVGSAGRERGVGQHDGGAEEPAPGAAAAPFGVATPADEPVSGEPVPGPVESGPSAEEAAADGGADAAAGGGPPALAVRDIVAETPAPEAAGGAPDAGAPVVATLPGFRMLRSGRSRVFVELSAPATVRESIAAGRLTYRLAAVRVPARVNQLALPTDYFSTPVARVRLLQVAEDAELVIELRASTRREVHLRPAARGVVLTVDFPKHEGLAPAVIAPQQAAAVAPADQGR
ncbi:MAG: hypothetical protein HY744_02840 [Deltaproteobacteria bacterium]|nr:hypothetical protein [Deltaproteobacteria bacterium]